MYFAGTWHHLDGGILELDGPKGCNPLRSQVILRQAHDTVIGVGQLFADFAVPPLPFADALTRQKGLEVLDHIPQEAVERLRD